MACLWWTSIYRFWGLESTKCDLTSTRTQSVKWLSLELNFVDCAKVQTKSWNDAQTSKNDAQTSENVQNLKLLQKNAFILMCVRHGCLINASINRAQQHRHWLRIQIIGMNIESCINVTKKICTSNNPSPETSLITGKYNSKIEVWSVMVEVLCETLRYSHRRQLRCKKKYEMRLTAHLLSSFTDISRYPTAWVRAAQATTQ